MSTNSLRQLAEQFVQDSFQKQKLDSISDDEFNQMCVRFHTRMGSNLSHHQAGMPGGWFDGAFNMFQDTSETIRIVKDGIKNFDVRQAASDAVKGGMEAIKPLAKGGAIIIYISAVAYGLHTNHWKWAGPIAVVSGVAACYLTGIDILSDFDKLRDIPMFGDMFYSQHQNGAVDLARTVVPLWSTISGMKGTFNGKDLENFMKSCGNVHRSIDGLGATIESVIRILEKFINWILRRMGIDDIALISTSNKKVAAWANEVYEYSKGVRDGDIQLTGVEAAKVYQMESVGKHLMLDSEIAKSPDSRYVLDRGMRIIESLASVFQATGKTKDALRMRPVSAYFHGESGVGKSFGVVPLVQETILRVLETEAQKDAFLENKNSYLHIWSTADGYQNGYLGQTAVIFDDYQQKTTIAGGAQDSDNYAAIRMINNMEYMTPQAAVEMKGKSSFTSEFVVATSNYLPTIDPAIHKPEAAQTRFDYWVEVLIKDEYTNEFNSISVSEPALKSVWKDHPRLQEVGFEPEIYQYRVRTSMGNMRYEPMSFDELVQCFVKAWRVRKSSHYKMVSALNTRLQNIRDETKIPDVGVFQSGPQVIEPDDEESVSLSMSMLSAILEATDDESNGLSSDSPTAPFDGSFHDFDDLLEFGQTITPGVFPFAYECKPGIDISDRFFEQEWEDIAMELLRQPNIQTWMHEWHIWMKLTMWETVTDAQLLRIIRILVGKKAFPKLVNFVAHHYTLGANGAMKLDKNWWNVTPENLVMRIFRRRRQSQCQGMEQLICLVRFVRNGEEDYDELQHGLQTFRGKMTKVFTLVRRWLMTNPIVQFVILWAFWYGTFSLIAWALNLVFGSKPEEEIKMPQVPHSWDIKREPPPVPVGTGTQQAGDLGEDLHLEMIPLNQDVPIPTGFTDVDSEAEDLYDMLHRKSMYLVSNSVSGEKLGQATFYYHKRFIMQKHFITIMEYRNRMRGSDAGLTLTPVEKGVCADIVIPFADLLKNADVTGRDLCLVDLSHMEHVRAHRDIRHCFITKHDIESLPVSFIINIAVPRKKMWQCQRVPSRFGDKLVTDLKGMPGKMTYRNAVFYSASTKFGDCGAPLVLHNSRIRPGKIMGFHSVGFEACMMAASPVFTREMLDIADARLTQPEDGTHQSGTDISMAGFTVIRQLGPRERSNPPTWSKIRKSKLYGVFPSHKRPAPLCPTFHEGRHVDPLIEAVLRYKPRPPANFSRPALTMAIQLLINHDSQHSIHRSAFNTVYTVEQAVFGEPSLDYFNPMPRHTSAGYTIKVAGRKYVGYKGKEVVMGRPDEGPGPMWEWFKERVAMRISQMERGQLPEFLFDDFGKDECLKLTKLCRLICGSDMDLLAISNMYFIDWPRHLQRNRILNGHFVGVNIYSAEFGAFIERMQSRGPNVLSVDASKFDASHDPTVLTIVLEEYILKFWPDATPEETNVRRMIFKAITESTHVFRDTVYQWKGAMPSGNPLTLHINSTMSDTYVAYAWVRACFESGRTLEVPRLTHHVYWAKQGDDIALNISEEACLWFNGISIQRYAAELGYTITPEEKGADMPLFRRNLDFTFLKRRPVYSEIVGRYVGALDLSTVLEFVQWTIKGLGSDDNTRARVNLFFQELSLHEQEVWNKYAPRMFEWCRKRLNYLPAVTDRAYNQSVACFGSKLWYSAGKHVEYAVDEPYGPCDGEDEGEPPYIELADFVEIANVRLTPPRKDSTKERGTETAALAHEEKVSHLCQGMTSLCTKDESSTNPKILFSSANDMMTTDTFQPTFTDADQQVAPQTADNATSANAEIDQLVGTHQSGRPTSPRLAYKAHSSLDEELIVYQEHFTRWRLHHSEAEARHILNEMTASTNDFGLLISQQAIINSTRDIGHARTYVAMFVGLMAMMFEDVKMGKLGPLSLNYAPASFLAAQLWRETRLLMRWYMSMLAQGNRALYYAFLEWTSLEEKTAIGTLQSGLPNADIRGTNTSQNVEGKTTAFNDQDTVRRLEFVNSNALPPGLFKQLSDGNDHDIISTLARPVPLCSNTWTTSHIQGTRIISVEPLGALVTYLQNKRKVHGFKGIRADIRCRLNVNCSRTQQGRLRMFGFLNPTMSDKYNTMMSDTRLWSALPGVDFDAAVDSDVEMLLPYCSQNAYYDLTTGSAQPWNVTVAVYGTLSTGSAPVTATATLFLSLENVQIEFPTIPSALQSGILQAGPSEDELSPEDKPISSTLNAVATVGKAMGAVPNLSIVGRPLAWAAGVAANAASAMGFSNPLSSPSPNVINKRPVPYGPNADGEDLSYNMGVTASNGIEVGSFGPTAADEMSFDYFLKIPAFVTIFDFATTNVAGDLLLGTNVGPLCQYFSGSPGLTNSAGDTSDGFIGTPLQYAATSFSMWRGCLDLYFKIVKSEFHSGRIMVAFSPTMTGTAAGTDYSSMSYAHKQIIDLRNTSEFKFSIPFASTSPYKKLKTGLMPMNTTAGKTSCNDTFWKGANDGPDCCIGRIFVWAVNRLECPANVSQNITFLVEMAAGDDFELAGFCPPHVQPYWFNFTPNATGQTNLASPVFQCGTMQVGDTEGNVETGDLQHQEPGQEIGGVNCPPVNNAPARYCVGERILSIRQLTKRACLHAKVNTITGQTDLSNYISMNYYFSPWNVYWPSPLTYNYTAGSNTLRRFTDAIDWWGACFAFQRGTIRMKGYSTGRTTQFSSGTVVPNIQMYNYVGNYTMAPSVMGAGLPSVHPCQLGSAIMPKDGVIEMQIPYYSRQLMTPVVNAMPSQNVWTVYPEDDQPLHRAFFSMRIDPVAAGKRDGSSDFWPGDTKLHMFYRSAGDDHSFIGFNGVQPLAAVAFVRGNEGDFSKLTGDMYDLF